METRAVPKSKYTELSALVEARFPLPAASCTRLVLISAVTDPTAVIPLTATLYVIPEPETVAVVAPPVPVSVTSLPSKPDTGSEN